MDVSIIVAIITGLLTLTGTVITVRSGNDKMQNTLTHQLETHNAVQDEKITELTREVRRHNDFAERIPRIEAKIETLEDQIKHIK